MQFKAVSLSLTGEGVGEGGVCSSVCGVCSGVCVMCSGVCVMCCSLAANGEVSQVFKHRGLSTGLPDMLIIPLWVIDLTQ